MCVRLYIDCISTIGSTHSAAINLSILIFARTVTFNNDRAIRNVKLTNQNSLIYTKIVERKLINVIRENV